MSASPIATPPAKAVQAALRKTTETLAGQLARPTEAAPDWSEVEWLIARAVAATHGVSALLSGALRWQGPPGWSAFLQDQRDQTLARHRRIEELLRVIDRKARDAGIAVLALKGVELHAMGLYSPGERPMGDVDLLVRSEDFERAARMLESLGYAKSFSTWKHRVLVPRDVQTSCAALGEHADNHLKIELHDRIAEQLPVDIVDLSPRVWPPRPHPGVNCYPSRAALMTHLLLHAAGAMAFRALRMLHLHDFALLCPQMSDEDWNEVMRGAGERGAWWAWPPLCLTARYYTGAVPARVLATASAACPRRLRLSARRWMLSDVSLSHLWIDAFPGIQWSQSLSETTRYVMSRVRPGRERLTGREHWVRTYPSAAASRWDHLSQGRRVLVWLVSHPTRSEIMHPVRAALAQTP
jgi:hypothetical protein